MLHNFLAIQALSLRNIIRFHKVIQWSELHPVKIFFKKEEKIKIEYPCLFSGSKVRRTEDFCMIKVGFSKVGSYPSFCDI